MWNPRALLVTSVTAALLGCGDPLVPGTRLDEPSFIIEGAIAPYDVSRPTSIGILWVDPALAGGAPTVSGAEQLEARIATNGAFSLKIFGRPPKEAVKWLAADASSDAVALAWGELVLFEDNDGDGTFRVDSLEGRAPMAAPDQYAGVAEKHVLIYVEEPAEEGTQILGLARTLAAPGYVVGEAHCDNEAFVIAVEPNTVSLRAVAATSRLPTGRSCFESIP
jgi:hypothetical protein